MQKIVTFLLFFILLGCGGRNMQSQVMKYIDNENIQGIESIIKNVGVDMRLKNGDTILNYSIKNKKIAVSNYLIEHGACLSLVDFDGNSPLVEAYSINNYQLIAKIITHDGTASGDA